MAEHSNLWILFGETFGYGEAAITRAIVDNYYLEKKSLILNFENTVHAGRQRLLLVEARNNNGECHRHLRFFCFQCLTYQSGPLLVGCASSLPLACGRGGCLPAP